MKTQIVCFAALLAWTASARGADAPNLDWLAGAWCHETADRSIEEHWLPARGGLMLGVNRTVGKLGTAFEFLRIELKGGGSRYIAQPGGAPPVAFELVSAAANRVVFANARHDFPKRVQYERHGDVLRARVDDGSDDGQAEEFTWRRCERQL